MVGPKAKIHLNRLKLNYDLIQNQVQGKPLMAVVKANGYGHGGVDCAKSLESHGCRFFAVFHLDEGIELREAGIKSEILVFSRIDSARLGKAISNDLILNISSSSDLPDLISYYDAKNVCPKVHIKVDTGMTRLGYNTVEIETLIHTLKDNPQIPCEGIYSHFSTADEGDLSYAYEQEAKFKIVLDIADEIGYAFKYIHFSNSGAVLNMDQSSYNIVRVGMLLYGAFPSNEVPKSLPVQPVMEFRAPVVEVRQVSAGTQVSYGGVYKTKFETNIGVIQCGFADGIPRPWYEGGYVSFNGRHFKIAGRICMDQFMVDFEETKPVFGDEVLLIGESGNDDVRMEMIAEKINSTPYVLATAIGGRTHRIYQD
ncbi:MAG: alanine racemase [Candidatus Marinimicrobia bacterium]|jgi:alanine racemase|nr:alanine racemase [Candidatus Neomarinimicrobiota bacterium]MBT3675108.1 alanine racemase [Candidatus Neomarinimicrobiota bacterium]MBT3763540.1 alanine racemase [Candidatus Neomarinimicrobiota bacterium]MBT4067571.1 alanine racemase [Candidatus Neomarinimicrobiota bacterium]MBT4270364.1 alanine racemase [Candidatus Neomarinimicrobiota bacterium]